MLKPMGWDIKIKQSNQLWWTDKIFETLPHSCSRWVSLPSPNLRFGYVLALLSVNQLINYSNHQ